MNSDTGGIIIRITIDNWKSLRGEDHKQAGFFAHFQTAGHSGFINDTDKILIRPIALTLLDVRIFG